MGVTSETFTPQFQEVEQVFVASGERLTINPTYCLTDESARDLAEILADLRPRIVQSTPYAVALDSVSFSHTVPWFKFPSGAACNCGVEANYWVNKNSPEQAEENCRKDLQSNEQCYAVDGDGQYPEELKGPY